MKVGDYVFVRTEIAPDKVRVGRIEAIASGNALYPYFIRTLNDRTVSCTISELELMTDGEAMLYTLEQE